MGSQVSEKDEINVLVTGFAPFREGYERNPAWEIAKDLPSYLPPPRTKDPKARLASTASSPIPETRILVHPEAVRVNYKTVRSLVPGLWDEPQQGRKIDLAVHIGMAGPLPMYQIERRGHRTGYKSPDVDGEKLEDELEGNHGNDWIWYGLPDELETEFDMPDVLRRWIDHSPSHLDLRLSDDPGRYLCDFIYYSSLAHLWKQQRPRKVLFFHVPADASEQSIETGRELVLNLIRSLVESELSKKR